MLKAQVVTLQLSKSRAFYFHLEALRFFFEFPPAIIDWYISFTNASCNEDKHSRSILDSRIQCADDWAIK